MKIVKNSSFAALQKSFLHLGFRSTKSYSEQTHWKSLIFKLIHVHQLVGRLAHFLRYSGPTLFGKYENWTGMAYSFETLPLKMYLIKPYLMFTNVFLVIKTHRNIAVCILTYDTEKSKYEKAAIFDLCYFQSGSASESNWW